MESNQTLPCASEVLDSLWLANSSPSFHGSAATMVLNHDKNAQTYEDESGNEELFDSCFNQPEKKRRLLPGQVRFLESNFKVDNKLEPERKVQLAKELGLQPRQVAIWFQNRRARYKNKQLEKDYDLLKLNYYNLNSDYENLFKENEKLKNEVHLLNDKMCNREKGEVKPERCDKNPIMTVDGESNKVKSNCVLDNVTLSVAPNVVGCKQEDASSAKSDVFDSDSPHCTNDSSNIFHEDEIDTNSLCKSLLCAPSFLKLEDDCYDDLQPNPCILGLNGEDQGTWFFNY